VTDQGITENINPSTGRDGEGLLITLSNIFEITWKYRMKILRAVIIFTVLAIIVSFIMPKSYVAETTIMPDIDMINLASKLGNLADLASAAGLNTGITSPSELNPDIITSETILRRVIHYKYKTEKYDSLVNLIQYWKFDDPDENLNFEKCVDKMQNKVMSVSVDKKTQMLTLDVETHEAQLSADIANRITMELDDFQRNFRKTNASAQRKFLEGRLDEVKQDLNKSEDNLKDFQEKNRRVEQSPQLMLEQGRLQRAIDLNSALFIELEKQYELAKLDEIRNTPVVQVLDPARTPAEKSSPKRALIAILAALASLIFVPMYYYLRDFIDQHPDDPEIERFLSLWRNIRIDLRSRKK
jgi:uncharacterized protein involved in exopolysaccharide biosynthesis